MYCYLQALTAAQALAFQSDSSLVEALLDREDAAQMDALEARLPPQMRAEFEAARIHLDSTAPAGGGSITSPLRDKLVSLGPFEPMLDLDKSWHALHYCITGHVWAEAAPGNIILGGQEFGEDIGYGPPRLHDAGMVKAFDAFLSALPADRVVERADGERMIAIGIYGIPQPFSAEDQRWLKEDVGRAFKNLKAYVDRAATAGDFLTVMIT